LAERREAVFQKECLEDLAHWVKTDRKVALRVLRLVEAALKYLGPGIWSRRITEEHRLVYMVRGDRIDFLQARYHY